MLDLQTFFPQELKIVNITLLDNEINIEVISEQNFPNCPICQTSSARIHSYYSRRLMDHPILGTLVVLSLNCRKFRCNNNSCQRSIFTEQFTSLIENYARRTNRLQKILRYISFSSNAETNGKLAKKTVRRYLRLPEEVATKYQLTVVRPSKLDQYANLIREHICKGLITSDICRKLLEVGYEGCDSNARQFIEKLKKTEEIVSQEHKSTKKKISLPKEKKWITRSDLIHYLWAIDEKLNEEKRENRNKIFQKYPKVKYVHQITQEFRKLMKQKKHKSLKHWIKRAIDIEVPEITTFAQGLLRDFSEIKNAFIYSYSSGFVEGNINRLKVIKRQMYGRASFDLLRKRVCYKT